MSRPCTTDTFHDFVPFGVAKKVKNRFFNTTSDALLILDATDNCLLIFKNPEHALEDPAAVTSFHKAPFLLRDNLKSRCNSFMPLEKTTFKCKMEAVGDTLFHVKFSVKMDNPKEENDPRAKKRLHFELFQSPHMNHCDNAVLSYLYNCSRVYP